MWGAIGILAEIAALIVGWMIYRKGYGVGAEGVIPMLWGIAVGSIGFVLGGILGAVGIVAGLLKNERFSITATIAILIPLITLVLLLTGLIKL